MSTSHATGQRPDGSYDVFGTTSGSPVMLEVSKDLKTITANAHGPATVRAPLRRRPVRRPGQLT
ncbi:MAG: hypothetical protein ACXVYU_09235, partial [Oryzihumus sp.]